MKHPLTQPVCVLFLAFITLGLFGNSTVLAQGPDDNNSSIIFTRNDNLRSAPSVIFRIENTLTPPSEYFEYLEMNFFPPSSIEQISPGVFHIYDLSPFNTYTLEFKGNGPMLLGVTTADISKILRHILGFGALDPDRLIAADATCDGRVSAADLVDIRKVILGKAPAFGCGVSWKFVPASSEFLYVGTTIDLGTIKAIKIGHAN